MEIVGGQLRHLSRSEAGKKWLRMTETPGAAALHFMGYLAIASACTRLYDYRRAVGIPRSVLQRGREHFPGRHAQMYISSARLWLRSFSLRTLLNSLHSSP